MQLGAFQTPGCHSGHTMRIPSLGAPIIAPVHPTTSSSKAVSRRLSSLMPTCYPVNNHRHHALNPGPPSVVPNRGVPGKTSRSRSSQQALPLSIISGEKGGHTPRRGTRSLGTSPDTEHARIRSAASSSAAAATSVATSTSPQQVDGDNQQQRGGRPSSRSAPVLIIGGGPAGLSSALMLAWCVSNDRCMRGTRQ